MFYVSLSVAGSYFSHVLSPPRHRSSLLIYSWQSHGGCSIIADKRFFKTLSPLVFFLFPSYPYLSLLLVAETVGFLCTLTLFISLQGKTELSFLTHCQSLSSSKVFHLIYTFFFSPWILLFLSDAQSSLHCCNIWRPLQSLLFFPPWNLLRTCLCFPLLPCFALCPLCSATAWTQAFPWQLLPAVPVGILKTLQLLLLEGESIYISCNLLRLAAKIGIAWHKRRETWKHDNLGEHLCFGYIIVTVWGGFHSVL